MHIAYYAVFNYDEQDKIEYGISIAFPDVPVANSCARNDAEGLEMALEVLQLALVDDHLNWPHPDSLPAPTPLEKIKLQKNEKAFLISFDTEDVDMNQFETFV